MAAHVTAHVNPFALLAAAVLLLHLLFILWVAAGAFLTRGRPALAWLHVGSLLYSITIEATSWPCPLTGFEQDLQRRAGMTPYEGGFLAHYLERLVYPDLPPPLVVGGAIAVCVLNLGVYARRLRRRRR
jgi:hypothetical protein